MRRNEPQQAGYLDRVFNSTIGLPQQFIWRVWRALADEKVDLFSEKGILDAALIPVFGMADTHQHDVMPDYVVEELLGWAKPGQSGFGSQLAASIIFDPLYALTGSATAAAKVARGVNKASTLPGYGRRVATAARESKQTVRQFTERMPVQMHTQFAREALEEAATQPGFSKRMLNRQRKALTQVERNLDEANTLHRSKGATQDLTVGQVAPMTRDRQIAVGIPLLSVFGAKYNVHPGQQSWWRQFKDYLNKGATSASKFHVVNSLISAPGVSTGIQNITAPFRFARIGFKHGQKAVKAFLPQGDKLSPEQALYLNRYLSADGGRDIGVRLNEALAADDEFISKVIERYQDKLKKGLHHEQAFLAAMRSSGLVGRNSQETAAQLWAKLRGLPPERAEFPKLGSLSEGSKAFGRTLTEFFEKHNAASEMLTRGDYKIVPQNTESGKIMRLMRAEEKNLHKLSAAVGSKMFETGKTMRGWLNKMFKSGESVDYGSKEYMDYISHVARDNDQIEFLTTNLYRRIEKAVENQDTVSLDEFQRVLSATMQMDALPEELQATFQMFKINPNDSAAGLKALQNFMSRQHGSIVMMEKLLKQSGVLSGSERNAMVNFFESEVFPFIEREGEVTFDNIWPSSTNRRTVFSDYEEVFTPLQQSLMRREYNKHVVRGYATGPDQGNVLGKVVGREIGRLTNDQITKTIERIERRATRSMTNDEILDSFNPEATKLLDEFAENNKVTPYEALALLRRRGVAETRKVGRKVDEVKQAKLWEADRTNWTYDQASAELGKYGFEIKVIPDYKVISKRAPDDLGRMRTTHEHVQESTSIMLIVPTEETVSQWNKLYPGQKAKKGLMPEVVKDHYGIDRVRRPAQHDFDKLKSTRTGLVGLLNNNRGYFSLYDLMTNSRAFLHKHKKFTDAVGPGATTAQIEKRVDGLLVERLREKLVRNGVNDEVLRGLGKRVDESMLPNTLSDDLVHLRTAIERRTNTKLSPRLRDPGQIVPTRKRKAVSTASPRMPESVRSIRNVEVDGKLKKVLQPMGEWAKHYAKTRILLNEMDSYVQRANRNGLPISFDPQFVDDVEKHLAKSGQLLRENVKAGLSPELAQIVDDMQTLSAYSFESARKSGVWVPGSPVGYTARFFNQATTQRMNALLGKMDVEDQHILTRLGVKASPYHRRSFDDMTLEDLDAFQAELRTIANEKTASPKLKEFQQELDGIMEEAGIVYHGAKAQPYMKNVRLEHDPFLSIMQRLGMAQQNRTMSSYFDTLLAHSDGTNGETLMMGGRVVGVVDETGQAMKTPRSKLKAKYGMTDGVAEDGVPPSATTLEQTTKQTRAMPKSLLIEDSAGNIRAVEVNLFRETGYGVLPLARDMSAKIDPVGEELSLFRGDRPTIGNAFARSANRSNLHENFITVNSGEVEPELFDNLLGQTVVIGSKNHITSAVKAAAEVHRVESAAWRTFDAVNYFIKSAQTIFRLPFHVANLSSGVFQSSLAGASPKNIVAGYYDALRLLVGNQQFGVKQNMLLDMFNVVDTTESLGIKRAFSGDRNTIQAVVRSMGSGELSEFLARRSGQIDDLDLHEHLVIHHADGRQTDLTELIQVAGEMQLFGTFASSLTRGSRSIGENLVRAKAAALDPKSSNVVELGGRVLDRVSRVAENSEVLNRLATTIALVREGHTMRRAVEIAREAHVPYERLTPFEARRIKRFSVYYTFPRHYMPWAWTRFAEDPAKLAQLGHFIRDQNVLTTQSGAPTLVAGDYRLNLARLNANLEAAGMIAGFADRILMRLPGMNLIAGDDVEYDRRFLRNAYSFGGLTTAGGVASMFADDLLPQGERTAYGQKDFFRDAADLIWPIKAFRYLAGMEAGVEDRSAFTDYTMIEEVITDNMFGVGLTKVRKQNELLDARRNMSKLISGLRMKAAAATTPEKRDYYLFSIKHLADGFKQVAAEAAQKQ